MNILFICGSAEPGKDGVGDYTRRFCGALMRLGHNVQIVSLCDYQAISFTNENQIVEGTSIIVNRIPVSASYDQRIIWSQDLLNDFEPDWISLQFVPYSFNPKGLPFWLPSFLKKLKGNHQWHIMFHELWLGIDKESSLKHKCIGKLQQLLIKKIIHTTQPYIINTQNKLYQFFLKSHNIKAEVLPICGNIPLTAVKKEAIEYFQFVLFGTIHNGAPFEDFINDIKSISNQYEKPIKFIFIGINGSELISYTKVLLKYKICYEVMGMQSESVISQVLLDSDFGISTTPYLQTEKSGVYAAYREHQLNAVCIARKWTPTKGQYDIPQIMKYEKNNLIIKPINLKMFHLNSLAKQFMDSIYKSKG